MSSPKSVKTAMVVDDEAPVRKLVKAMLSTSGFQVIEAQDGKEAWGMIQNNGTDVDVVVTDIRMPEVDGVTLATWILESHPDIPVVLMSGYSEAPTASLENRDRWTFLAKPFAPQTLIGAIQGVLDSGKPGGFSAGAEDGDP